METIANVTPERADEIFDLASTASYNELRGFAKELEIKMEAHPNLLNLKNAVQKAAWDLSPQTVSTSGKKAEKKVTAEPKGRKIIKDAVKIKEVEAGNTIKLLNGLEYEILENVGDSMKVKVVSESKSKGFTYTLKAERFLNSLCVIVA